MSVREGAKEALPTFYLTLVSMISSLALGYFCSTLEFNKLFGNGWSFVYLCKVFATFEMILLVWHEYVMGTIFFRWVIGYSDSIILFLFGIVLFATIRVINSSLSTWLLMQAFFALLGSWAYWNQFWKAKREEENAKVFDIISFHHVMISLTVVSAGLFILGSVVSNYWPSSNLVQRLLTGAANVVYLGIAVASYFLREPVLRKSPPWA